jgi:hypothetical protein
MTESRKRFNTPGTLWLCPSCGRRFANKRQTHSCGNHDLISHFAGKPVVVKELFDAFVALLNECGPFRVLPEKTRIAFQVRMSFAAVSIRRTYIVGHFVLARRLDSPRFSRIQTISPRNHVHQFRLNGLSDLDREFLTLAREAYRVGEQRHIQ